MSIRKRGNIWWMRFTAPDGREIRESTQTADKRQAQEYHDARKAELWRQAKLGEQPRHTWQEAVVRWIEEHPGWDDRSGVAISFRQAHDLLGDHGLDNINAEVMAQLTRQFRQAGMKPGTINTRTGHILAVLHAAQRWGWLGNAPKIQKLPVIDRRLRWLTRDEADRLLAELPAHLAAMMRFSLATGLREQHDLRHTWASWHVQAGTPLPVLKELGGWASLDMVLRYAHLGADHLAEHAERISGPRLVRTKSGTAPEKAAATG